ncbi:MAG TPA: M28 family peptidase [Ohtaekwangia sp.]
MRGIVLTVLILLSTISFSQTKDEQAIREIYNQALTHGKGYTWLEYMCKKIGSRLSGSPGAAQAVQWTKDELDQVADSVWLQPVMVPQWVRGQKEKAKITGSKRAKSIDLNVCALGLSVGTGPEGVKGKVIEVKNFDQLKQLGEKEIKGKIVFFSRPMDATHMNTFAAYGGAVDQRGSGPSEAAKYGAVGVIVRSMGSNPENYPHTGSLRYAPNTPKIPAIAVSTNDGDMLSAILREEKNISVYFETHCETLADVQSHNVIAEIKGSEFPEEVIVVSGHLDSWDLAEGAHDDGAGCVQAMDVLWLFKQMGYKPRHTIRCVLYMNEENGLRGGIEYAKQVELAKEKHVAAMESDRGGFTPRGFSMSAPDEVKNTIRSWKPLLEPYGLTDFNQSGGGADIGPLEPLGVPIIGYLPDSQRYFDYHHTKEDTFDKVSRRELELGSASMAALTYLIDVYGLP